MLLLWQVWSSMFPLRHLPLQINEYTFGIEDGDKLARNLPFGFVLLTDFPFGFDLTTRTSSVSSSAFGMNFFVEALRDFFSDASTELLLTFSVGTSTTESPTTEASSLGFFVRFGVAFVSSGMVSQSDLCSKINENFTLWTRFWALKRSCLFNWLAYRIIYRFRISYNTYISPLIIPVIAGGCSSVTTSIVFWDCLRGLLRRAGLESSLSVDLARDGDADALRRGCFNGEVFPRRMSTKVLRFVVGTNILWNISYLASVSTVKQGLLARLCHEIVLVDVAISELGFPRH